MLPGKLTNVVQANLDVATLIVRCFTTAKKIPFTDSFSPDAGSLELPAVARQVVDVGLGIRAPYRGAAVLRVAVYPLQLFVLRWKQATAFPQTLPGGNAHAASFQ